MSDRPPQWTAIRVVPETPNIWPTVYLEGQIWSCSDCPFYWEDRIRCTHPESTFDEDAFTTERLLMDAPPFPDGCPWFKKEGTKP